MRTAVGTERTHLSPPERAPALSALAGLDLLRRGALEIQGRLVDASNATFYCVSVLDGTSAACIYKPVRGERPLWDFPDGTLAGREVATFLVSQATGWDLVPPTVLRDGPLGPGMCQLWVEGDESVDLRDLVSSDHPDLSRIAVLDAVVNNADRKGGHLIPTTQGRVFGVDHGVCFAVQDKLRTLLWQWRGHPLDPQSLGVLSDLEVSLEGALGAALAVHLTRHEVRATGDRVRRLLDSKRFPFPSEDWPAVPWPPF